MIFNKSACLRFQCGPKLQLVAKPVYEYIKIFTIKTLHMWDNEQTHGLHLNTSDTSSIHVIISARVSPFFSLKAKAQRCLKCTDCNYPEFRNQGRTVDSSN